MRKAVSIIRGVFVIIGYIASIITVGGFIINFQEFQQALQNLFNPLDLYLISQIFLAVGIIIVISCFLIFIFVRISNRYEPSRTIADIIAPILLSKDVIGDPESTFTRKLLLFKVIRFGASIVIVGLVSYIVILLFSGRF